MFPDRRIQKGLFMKYNHSTDICADFHKICITRTASTVLSLLGVSLPPEPDAPIEEVLHRAVERFSPVHAQAPCDRIFLYNPDAVAMWIYEKYAGYFTEMEKCTDLRLPMLSVFPPVTPVCFGSMYSGLQPAQHGILKYEKPVLRVPTLFDILSEAGLKAAIVSTEGDSISRIFLERKMDYYIYPKKETCNQKALELIAQDRYDCIVLYNGDYDYHMHRCSPEGKRALKALHENIATFQEIHTAIHTHWSAHRTALVFAPDHGCHRVYGFLGSHGINRPCDMNIPHFYSFIG